MNMTVRKPTEMEKLHTKAAVMTMEQLNHEVNRRLTGINSGMIKGDVLNKLKKEASLLARMILNRG